MRTQVAIIGGGPSGLLLSRRLSQVGIESAIIERQQRDHVLSRIRAGLLEWGTVEQLRAAGVSKRMDQEGLVHDGVFMASGESIFRIDFAAAIGQTVMVYGQTEITKDLYEVLDADKMPILHGAEGVQVHNVFSESPFVTYALNGRACRIDCDFVVGCDGFHGVSRNSIPSRLRKEFERVYPFGWLGILSESAPVHNELIYCRSKRGFALASMRTPTLSRYYIQVDSSDCAEQWSNQQFWDEFRRRLPSQVSDSLEVGTVIEKSIAPLRSFVCEPMRHGRLFLCGDAAHIVPPTGAKGLNLAASDVHYLAEAISGHYQIGDSSCLENYSERALARVWKAMRFSWWMTTLLHNFPDRSGFDRRIQDSEFEYLNDSPVARRALAENYTGLPY